MNEIKIKYECTGLNSVLSKFVSWGLQNVTFFGNSVCRCDWLREVTLE
jgi:hypothetical protein